MQDRQMACTYHFNGAVALGASQNKSSILARQGAFAKKPIGKMNHARERDLGLGQSTKSRMEVAHEHGSSQTLARDVAKKKQQSGSGLHQVTKVSTHYTCRLIVIPHMPAGCPEIGARQ